MNGTTEIRDGFAWDPPVPLDWLVAGTLAVLLWLAVLGLSEWRLAKRPWLPPLLWLLRGGAVVAVAAALAGPSKTLTRRESSRQAVAILVDSSASMALTDPDEFVPSWPPGGGADDSLLGMLAAARHHLGRLSAMPPGQWGTAAGEQRWADAAAVMRKTAAGRAGLDFRQASERLEATAKAFSSGQSVLARDCLRVLADAEAALSERVKSIEAGTPAVRPGSVAGKSATRLSRAADWLEAGESGWLRDCREEFEVHLLDAGDVIAPVSAGGFKKWREATRAGLPQRTDLAAVLDGAGREAALDRARAVVLVTDGGHNGERDAVEAAARLKGLPLLLVPAGAVGGLKRRDLSLPSLLAPASIYKNDSMRLEAIVAGMGCDGETVEAVLFEGERRIESKTLRIRDGAPEAPLEFTWRPDRLGRHQLKVELIPLKGEDTLENNRQEISVEVLDDTLRLLVADGGPRWETRYLLNLLKRDARMEFQPLLFSPLHRAEGTESAPPAFPSDADSWARHRIVVLGDLTPRQLTPEHQTLLVKYVVERGGTLVIIAGEEAMPAAFINQPLGALIPVTGTPCPEGAFYSIGLSPEALDLDPMGLAETPAESDRVWREATGKLPVYDLSPYSVPKPQAHVLLEARSSQAAVEPAGGRSLLTWQDAGKGRVIYLAAPVTWHLRYLSGDQWHYRFWGQLFQWALARGLSGGSRTVHLSAERPRLPQDAPLNMLLRLEDTLGNPVADAECRAVLRTEAGLEKSVVFAADEKVPGSYRAVLNGLPLGPQRITVEGAAVDRLLKEEGRQGSVDAAVTIDPPENRELRGVLCDMGGIRRLAAAAEGFVLPPGGVAEALKNLGLRPSVSEQTSLTPVWNEWTWLALILSLLILEWILRKPAGLL
ncbi:MAG: hypothetical protein EOP86_03655 [Verrucomicrobiaceae bacterium]|nr:MAG: hypothetical protein EOP86_03655 [Verrucomicrobiaceae bacterium]